jgi:hypothetical protein
MNKPDTQAKPQGDKRDPMMETDRTRNTPGTDMQSDDAGTASSGNEGSGHTNPAESVMKQEHKTSSEKGSRG